MTAAIRKNPSVSDGLHQTLAGKLQYCDLRDLQDVVTAKTLWATFEPTFGTREMVNTRCGQLAELRNTIRHSRPLNDVTRRDGEAALAWFKQVLSREHDG